MGCDEIRDAISADLDGEAELTERRAVDHHLATCDACAQWVHDAEALTRLARTPGPVPPPPPGLVGDALLQRAPGPGRRRAATALRTALAMVGVLQFSLGMAQTSLASTGEHVHPGGVVTATHLWHESAAWNVALGAAFGWVALRRARPGPIIPLLTVFVALLAMLSMTDLVVGRVDGLQLASHAMVLVGYAIVVGLSRPSLDFGDPPASRARAGRRWSVRFDEAEFTPRALHQPGPVASVPAASAAPPGRGAPPVVAARHDRAA